MSILFSPLKIKNVCLKNRLVQSPMCMYSAREGRTNSWHFTHYGTRAVGGVGAIILEASAISPEGRITPGNLGIWSDEHIEGLSKIADFLKKQGTAPAILGACRLESLLCSSLAWRTATKFRSRRLGNFGAL